MTSEYGDPDEDFGTVSTGHRAVEMLMRGYARAAVAEELELAPGALSGVVATELTARGLLQGTGPQHRALAVVTINDVVKRAYEDLSEAPLFERAALYRAIIAGAEVRAHLSGRLSE